MNLKSKQEKIVSACVIIMVFVAAFFVCRPVFYLNDDVTMRSIMSGNYSGSPDGHAVYMKYPLTWVLRVLYGIENVVPWLELFFAGCLVWSATECISKLKTEKSGMWGVLIPTVLFMLPFFWYMHYTMIAAALAGTAAICLCCGKSKSKPVIVWLLAWMIRSQVAYLALPFLGVALLWRLISVKKEQKRSELICCGKICVAVLSGLLVCAGVNGLAYRSEKWQEYLTYNEVRTELYDYTNFHSTDMYGQKFDQYGMTRNDFLILDSYNTMLDMNVNSGKIGQVADKITAGMQDERNLTQWIKECVLKYYYEMRYSSHLYVYVWAAVLAVLMIKLLLEKNWLGASLVVCLEAGRSLIWLYLIYRGRFPERVVVSLYVIEILLLAGMLSRSSEPCKEKLCGIGERMKERFGDVDCLEKVCRAGFILVLSLILVMQVRADVQRTVSQAKTQNEWTVLKQYCEKDPETLYLIDVFSAVEYGGLQYQQDTPNMMLAGGWMSASPLAMERFEKIGAADGGQALFEKDQVLFVAEDGADLSWLEEYLNNRFGQCSLQQVNALECGENKVFRIWEAAR
jgi:hypothetical protein